MQHVAVVKNSYTYANHRYKIYYDPLCWQVSEIGDAVLKLTVMWLSP